MTQPSYKASDDLLEDCLLDNNPKLDVGQPKSSRKYISRILSFSRCHIKCVFEFLIYDVINFTI